MRIVLREVEPFNVPPVDNQEAAQFMRRLTGGETFECSGNQRPRCMMIYFLKYDHSARSFAQGWLFPMSIDELDRICNSHSGTMEDILKTHGLGSIRIEYGGNLAGASITATTSDLQMMKCRLRDLQIYATPKAEPFFEIKGSRGPPRMRLLACDSSQLLSYTISLSLQRRCNGSLLSAWDLYP